jgi:hypothetical protein
MQAHPQSTSAARNIPGLIQQSVPTHPSIPRARTPSQPYAFTVRPSVQPC